MTVYMFPGQGAQSRGMGKDLFDRYPEYTRKADEVLGYSIADLCLEDPDGKLGRTEFTQPALFVVNVLSYLRKLEDTGRFPTCVIGHSLGEYNALFAAGAFDFETGLRLVQKRGALMAEARDGGMAAVIGLTEAEVEAVLKEEGLEALDIANLNAPTQIILSGLRDDVSRAGPIFQAAGATRYVPLRVSGAFHSRYMAPARDEFARFVAGHDLGDLRLRVIANATAAPYQPGATADTLVQQIVSPVRWSSTIAALRRQGEVAFEELGPGRVLTSLLAQIPEEA